MRSDIQPIIGIMVILMWLTMNANEWMQIYLGREKSKTKGLISLTNKQNKMKSMLQSTFHLQALT